MASMKGRVGVVAPGSLALKMGEVVAVVGPCVLRCVWVYVCSQYLVFSCADHFVLVLNNKTINLNFAKVTKLYCDAIKD